MTKKVLVLCQRKSGTSGKDRNETVESTIVPKINEMANGLLGEDIDIKYLTDLSYEKDGEADYNFSLDRSNEEAARFMEENRGTYSMIILNTCPIAMMDMNMIHELLEPNGVVFFSIFPKANDADLYRSVDRKMAGESEMKMFIRLTPILYRKKLAGGKKTKRSYKFKRHIRNNNKKQSRKTKYVKKRRNTKRRAH